MDRLRTTFLLARDLGQAHTLCVVGGAGIGKTRLLDEWLAEVTAAPEVRVCRASATSGGGALASFARLLRSRFGLDGSLDTSSAKNELRQAVAQTLDDRKVGDVLYFFGQMLELEFPESPVTRAVANDPAPRTSLLSALVRSFVEADCAHGPLVLILDDAHCVDPESLALLKSLAEGAKASMMIVLAGRPELAAIAEEWARLPRHGICELPPLSDEHAIQTAHGLLAPCGEPPMELVETACALANGNPAMLHKIVDRMREAGILVSASADRRADVWGVDLEKLPALQVPLSVEDAIAARISALASDDRALLEHAALMGGVFWLGGLVALCRSRQAAPEIWQISDEVDREHISERLQALIDLDYVLKLPDSTFSGDEEFVFKHNLERVKIAQLTSPTAAKRAHRIIADWLENQELAQSSEEPLAMVAAHREKAGDTRRAALSYLEAATLARQANAVGRAADYISRGLLLLGEDEPARRMQALFDLANFLEKGGKSMRAADCLRQVAELSFQLHARHRGAEAHLRLGELLLSSRQAAEARRHWQAGLSLARAVDHRAMMAGCLERLGRLDWREGQHDHSAEQLREALCLNNELRDAPAVLRVIIDLGQVLKESGHGRQAGALFEEGIKIAKGLGGMGDTIQKLGTLLGMRDAPV